ncbi:autotransporter outer membrane beta-barrel domain-containing protein [Bradyrhizobium sp. WSM 1704]|uniref:autotransporter outer membrane beta-barrel domain-containing protein n=1 Tax=Bradyrhizobium semiaridum TaxID=2821404 RepID=UPI001CE3659A|nr:autotransporter outer membrane beta-barrel domain-containing protein [Bradyrhizobium semiaridum]MCA6125775.1 autotransporter outer membrane beta-barrel domain-containing protein [Bradyrhizobium semiaridum]
MRECIGAVAGTPAGSRLIAFHARRMRGSATFLTRLLLSATFVGSAGAAQAGNYTAFDETSLRNAVNAANADPDPSASITLTNNVAVASSTAFPAFAKPTTISTGAFTLSGADISSGAGNGGNLIFLGGSLLTTSGAIRGGNADASTATGLAGSGGTALLISNGSITNAASVAGGLGGGAYRRTGGVGGVAANLTNSSLTNQGSLTGGRGGDVNSGGFNTGTPISGGNGGVGLLMNGGSLNNLGTIAGGAGGTVINTFPAIDNFYGGGGGLGANLTGGNHSNSGTISGGIGGTGRNSAGSTVGGPGGGGLVLAGGATFVNNTTGTILGGNGTLEQFSARGGGGGVGATIAASSLTNNGAIRGGTGAGTGAGGVGAALTAGADVTNNNTIVGGTGGPSGVGGSGMTIANATLTNVGSVAGGSGGGGASAGGVGITGTGATIINSSTISGGLSGNGVTRNNAITFTAGANRLELRSGSVINGNVVGAAAAGSSDTLVLGGAASSSFNVSNIGAAAQYRNFDFYQKIGASTWTLTNTTTATTSWQILGGTLAIDSDANLGAAAGTLTFDGGRLENTGAVTSARNATINAGGGTFQTDADLTWTGPIGGTGALTKTGPATLTLSGANTYSGGTFLNGGTIAVSNDGNLGAASGALMFNGGTLRNTSAFATSRPVTLNAGGGTFQTNADLTVSGVIGGTGALAKTGSGTLTMTGANGYTGGTTISAGTLQLGNGGTSGSIVGNILNNGVLAFNRSDTLVLGGLISGTGAVEQVGSGTTILSGNNSYSGATTVAVGTLIVNGDQTAATGSTTVASGATLGGNGVIGGNVTIANAATLAPGDVGNAPGTLTVKQNLTLNSGSITNVNFGQANVVGGLLNDHIVVGGNLTIAGTLNVSTTSGGSFSPGLYRVMSYNGTLTNNGLAIGTIPSPNFFLQTSVANQVNLVNTSGLTLNFWDGNAGPKNDGVIDGGNGVWQSSAGNDNWTTISGTPNAPFTDAAFAVFAGIGGNVTVDNSLGQVSASGMQFAANGYHLSGGSILLSGAPDSIIRVGDDTAAGASFIATIDNVLAGNTRLVKTDLGTLALNGANTYTGGTAMNGGTVQISNDANLGAASGGLSFDGGALRNTAAMSTARAVTLNGGGGTFQTDADLSVSSAIDGVGSLTKIGVATLTLTGDGTYTGGTTITAGTLQLGNGGTSGSVLGDIVDNSALAFNRSDTFTVSGAISGTGRVNQIGSGITVLTGNSTYTGGTTISAGTLQLGNGGTSGSIAGNVLDNSALAFNRSDTTGFTGLISGTGAVNQIGSGTTILTANNSYTGPTTVSAGTLIVNGDQGGATGQTFVGSGGTLGGNGTIGGNVVVADGAINPGNPGNVPGTLTIQKDLSLASNSTLNYNFGQANVVGGALNDLTVVKGNLTLGGTINVSVSGGGSFDVGIYRVISYSGSLMDNGLQTGTIPSPNYFVQTSVTNQVNLVNTAGLTLNYWDGAAGPKFKAVNGGDGVWQNSVGNNNWTTISGDINAPFTNAAFAVFAATPGTVTVDNSLGQVSASGMQFASNGYHVLGGEIALAGSPSSVIRVGDGTAAGAGYVAAIDNVLSGNTQLAKTDLGTLILNGINTYTGGTAINGGTLRISQDANLGAAAGALSLDGGTLQNTAAVATARGVTLGAGGGTFQTNADLTSSGLMAGAGALTKTGAGTLILTGDNAYTGGTNVIAGTLIVNGNQSAATGPTSIGNGAILGGTGTIGGSVSVGNGGALNPGNVGAVGTLTINGNLALGSGAVLNYQFGQANVVGGALNDLINVHGNLTLAGTLNVSTTSGGSFDPGVYRVFNYDGALTNNGLTLGSLPPSNTFVQTSVANQVNLVNTAGLTLNYWDGAAGPKFNNAVNGGDGVWQNSAGNDNWTNDTGAINAPFANGAFAIFSAAPGTVTVDNTLGQVAASGMQFSSDGYRIVGGEIVLAGTPNSIIRVGDGTAAGAGFVATIDSVLSGNTQLVKTDFGKLVLNGANTYTGGTVVNGGTLSISSDANLGAAGTRVTLDTGTLQTTADITTGRNVTVPSTGTFLTNVGTTLALNGTISGAGDVVKDGAGTLLLNGAASNSGATVVTAGTLRAGATNVFSSTSAFTASGGATLDLNGQSQTVASLGNAGTVSLKGAPGATLTVTGNYVGSGGQLDLNTTLGSDPSSTDKLVVGGSTSGTSAVKVTNVGGTGAQTSQGIKIIDVAGASNGTFNLLGDYVFQGQQAVVGGAYAYTLQKNTGDGDWYLKSALPNPPPTNPPPTNPPPTNPPPATPSGPLYQPGVPLYENYAQVLLGMNEMPSLQQRVGNRYWGGADAMASTNFGKAPNESSWIQSAWWGRIDGKHADLNPSTTTGSTYKYDQMRLQSGLDGQLLDNERGRLIAGITVQYVQSTANIASFFGNGRIRADGSGVGGTLTWYGNNGFYVDAQAQSMFYHSDISSALVGRMTHGNEGFGYGFSVEGGKRIVVGGGWSLTPQAQLQYSKVDFDSFSDRFGALVSLANADSLLGRAGLSLNHQKTWNDGSGIVRSDLYGIANLHYEFLNGTNANVAGTSFASANDRLWGSVGAGGAYSWAEGRYAIYGEVSYNASLADAARDFSYKGTAGFRATW